MRNRITARRLFARIATITLGVTVPVLTVAAPALALHRDDGTATHYPSLGVGLTILYFVVIPLGAFALIAALAVLPSTLAKPRYRPGKPWDHGSEWFGSPDEAGDGVVDGASARGGASAEW